MSDTRALVSALRGLAAVTGKELNDEGFVFMAAALAHGMGADKAIKAIMAWAIQGKGWPSPNDLITLGKPKTGISINTAIDEARDAVVNWLEGRSHKGNPIADIAWQDLGGKDLRQQPVLDWNGCIKESFQRRIYGACRAAAERVQTGREDNPEARAYLGLDSPTGHTENLLAAPDDDDK